MTNKKKARKQKNKQNVEQPKKVDENTTSNVFSDNNTLSNADPSNNDVFINGGENVRFNNPEDIFDKCISSGRNNWQVYGSRKPGCKAYELKYYWSIDMIVNFYDIRVQF